MTDSTEHPQSADHASVMGTLVQRLRSQPLILVLGVVLVLATVATASLEGLRVLLPWVVLMAVVAIGAWLAAELVRLRGRGSAGSEERVRLSARNVSETGEVIGYYDETSGPAGGTRVNLRAKDVGGRVVGVEKRSPRNT